MLAFLYKLIIGNFNTCKHEWETISKCDMYENTYSTMSLGVKYTMCCKICGEIKSKKTY